MRGARKGVGWPLGWRLTHGGRRAGRARGAGRDVGAARARNASGTWKSSSDHHPAQRISTSWADITGTGRGPVDCGLLVSRCELGVSFGRCGCLKCPTPPRYSTGTVLPYFGGTRPGLIDVGSRPSCSSPSRLAFSSRTAYDVSIVRALGAERCPIRYPSRHARAASQGCRGTALLWHKIRASVTLITWQTIEPGEPTGPAVRPS